ncbi:MAG: phosphopyruvate hydratase [Chlamydiae bacterium]|jgi:enolase|nr:phosphopyruvate hydratase [Chlamydiota bacterium]
MSSKIQALIAREILDSRGNPTLEVDCILESGHIGRASVPSGASTGSHEAMELRDANAHRFFGKGVLKCISHVHHDILPALKGHKATEQISLDRLLIDLDGTEKKYRLGANTLLAVSLAAARASANYYNLPLFRYLGGSVQHKLPFPFFNIINGGKHADNHLDFQEFMISPRKEIFSENLRAGTEVYHTLKKLLHKHKLSTNVGDEGGFAPNIQSTKEALEMIVESIENAGYRPGIDIMIGLDVAANEIEHTDNLIDQYVELVERYPIISIEDGCKEDDFDGWHELNSRLGSQVQLIGDDLFVTNKKRLEFGIKRDLANSILIKPNQVGTLTETIETVKLAQENGFKVMFSHRSGETEDTFISDLCVALSVDQIKSGAPARGERVAKYNQLLRIEEQLN